MRKIAFISFLILILISVTLNAKDPNDPYEADTVYFVASGSSSGDTIFVPETSPPWDIAVDVMVWTDNGVAGITIPLKDTCYDDISMDTYLNSLKNDPDSVDPNCFTGSLLEDFSILSLNLYGEEPTPSPPNFLIGAVNFSDSLYTPGLIVHLIFTVSSYGCLCLDTIFQFQPGGARPYFTTPSAKNYVPVFLSKCFVISQTVDTPEKEESPELKKFELYPNYPNPFNPTTTIEYSLAQNSWVNLSIYNLLGQKVKTLINEYQNKGPKTVRWDGKDEYGETLSSGVYFCRLRAEEFSQSEKMILIR
ncbi:MAG: hypothetical protein AMJ90_02850 [candidate division Zixibacteria bacterium SM23_73_2]|nr:MAG: hypothetical protein AMJ90_02850 [candidate division Zixibacteria bacterium SM23_73_2]